MIARFLNFLFAGLFFLGVITGKNAFAAKVIHVGGNFAVIDAGRDHGLSLGDKVCFLGEKEQVIGCGFVEVLRSGLAGIRYHKDHLSEIVVWMSVKSETLKEKDTPTNVNQKDIIELANEMPQKEDGKKNPELALSSSATAPPRIARKGVVLSYLVTPVNPFLFYIPSYSLVHETDQKGPLWVRDRKVTYSPLGAQLALLVPVGSKWNLEGGIHYRWLLPDQLIASYDATNPLIGAEGKTTSQALGLFMGFVRWWGVSSRVGWRTGGGLSGDDSRVSHKVKTYDTESILPIAQISSRLLTWALKGDLGVQMPVGSLIFHTDMAVLVPFAGTSQSQVDVSGIRDSIAQEQKDSAKEDLIQALNHKRSSFSIQATVGVGAHF